MANDNQNEEEATRSASNMAAHGAILTANAVGLRLPTFWPKRPDVWFRQAEAEFELRNITTDNTKYNYVLTSLDPDTATRIADFLAAPPAADKFKSLKKRLINTYGLSQLERSNRLMHIGELGDKAPSDLMAEILMLCGDHGLCFLAQYVFLQALPPAVRLAMDGTDFTDHQAAARKADNLWNTHRFQTTLIERISAAETRRRTNKDKQWNPEWCFYHNRFGDAAKRCKQPCKHPKAENFQADCE